MSDKRIRIYKTLSWSIIAFLITTGVGIVLTGSLLKGGLIGVICRAIKIPTYWGHDAVWDAIKARTS